MIEISLNYFGSIGESSAIEFGVYYSKGKNEYITSNKWNNNNPVDVDKAFENILFEIIKLLEYAKSTNLKSINEWKIAQNYKGKILYLYYPDVCIPIFKEKDIDKFLFLLRISYNPN